MMNSKWGKSPWTFGGQGSAGKGGWFPSPWAGKGTCKNCNGGVPSGWWQPTPGGGFAWQYPPGRAGIPYAWYPGYGVVQ